MRRQQNDWGSAAIPSLRDVVRKPGSDYSADPCHVSHANASASLKSGMRYGVPEFHLAACPVLTAFLNSSEVTISITWFKLAVRSLFTHPSNPAIYKKEPPNPPCPGALPFHSSFPSGFIK